jgi:hypothetical protein
VNSLDHGLLGEEIGDECSFVMFIANGNNPPLQYFDPSNVTLNSNKYTIQPEYNNDDHACTTRP